MKHKKWLTVLFIRSNRRRYQVSIWAEGNDWVIEKKGGLKKEIAGTVGYRQR